MLVEKHRIIPEDEVLPCTFDPVFKAVLTSESCREYLADIVSYVTCIPRDNIINNLIIKNSELMKSNIREKRKTTDLIIDVLNNRINLEMNSEYYNGVIQKNNSYHDKLSSEQFLVGDDYSDVMKIIQINFDLYNKYDERAIIKFMIMDSDRGIYETENYEKYHVSLDVIRNKYYNNEELSREEKELLLLTMSNRQEIKELVSGDNVMENVEKKLEELSEDEELVGVYDVEIYNRKVRNSMIRYAVETALADAEEKANEERKKAMVEEHEKGHKEGQKQGVIQEKKSIAKNMLNQNFDVDTISKITGLSIDEINNLD